ncbi:putative multi-domain beta keto-acyl synthase [Plesiocystis pacifica SIR-1]|uniref:Putative multi-domain beta keto-acyl synthase n=1 Tax=Plesiocystis pacifica SIR-1 TaxID=391625 RepID=A6G4P0_9BACT|nr:type I polyketide synthase [Plesiocystis pacifica]EDM79160.1 putative multi-domain beta keto-acyl synthase [Plesiocystis pacifica SIR-1]
MFDNVNDQTQPMDPIAVVGMGALFPESMSPGELWANIVAGRDLITDVPKTHWLAEDYYDPQPGTADKVYAARGGFLPPVPFAPLEFGMPPNILPATDTSQLLALVVAKQVLEDALGDRLGEASRERISVILGVASATELVGHMVGRLQKPVFARAMRAAGFSDAHVERALDSVERCYVPWQESTFPGVLGNVVAGRVANRFDLGGTNVVLDAACASSLAAVEMAVLELQAGRADMVISGGVDALNDIFMHMCFGQTGALSLSGDCRPFSDKADGTLLGEGVGMVALRRLEDAERDGDRIYAVLKGIGSSSDGRAKSIYAPRPAGQAKAMRRAYQQAGYGPESVELVEAHGTGTVAGDAAEFESTSGVFADAEAAPGSVAFGSIKAQIGHTKAAAGTAGLMKVVMALHNKVLPPTIKVDAPSEALGLGESPLYLNTRARPWVHRSESPRRGSVSAFGFGGTNFHATLEEYRGPQPEDAKAERTRPPSSELVLLFGSTFAELQARCEALAAAVESGEERRSLRAIARASHREFDYAAAERLAIIVNGKGELVEPLRALLPRVAKGEGKALNTPRGASYRSGPTRDADGALSQAGKIALLFPGQGSQHLDMSGAAAMAFEAVREVWDESEALGLGLRQHVFPPPAFDEDGQAALEQALAATEITQPAIAVTSLAMVEALRLIGLEPDCVAGHSLGEVTALAAAGALARGEGMRVAKLRGELMAAAGRGETGEGDSGSMIAVRGGIEKVEAALAELPEGVGVGVVVANHNSPRQVVLSGPTKSIHELEGFFEERGIVARALRVSAAFHSPLVEGAVEPFAKALESCEWSTPRCPVYSNVTAEPYGPEPEGMRAQLASAIAKPVRFVEQIRAMYDAGVRTFIEVGPDAILSRLVKACLKGKPHVSVALDERSRDGLDALWRSIGQLATLGVPMQLDALWADEFEAPAPEPSRGMIVELLGANYGKPDLTALPQSEPVEAAVAPAAAPLSTPVAPSFEPVAAPLPSPVFDPAPTSVVAESSVQPPTSPAFEAAHAPMPADSPPHQPAVVTVAHQPSLIAAHLEFQRMMLANHETFLRLMTGAQAPAQLAASTPVALAPAPVAAAAAPVTATPAPAPMPAPAPVVGRSGSGARARSDGRRASSGRSGSGLRLPIAAAPGGWCRRSDRPRCSRSWTRRLATRPTCSS